MLSPFEGNTALKCWIIKKYIGVPDTYRRIFFKLTREEVCQVIEMEQQKHQKFDCHVSI